VTVTSALVPGATSTSASLHPQPFEHEPGNVLRRESQPERVSERGRVSGDRVAALAFVDGY